MQGMGPFYIRELLVDDGRIDDAKITEGKILFKEDNLLEKDLDCYRGKKIGMIFQNPLTYFDDYQNIEEHFYESLHTHF